MSETFDVIFEGEMVEGAAPEEVRKRLKVLLRADDEKIHQLFSGNTFVIRKGVNIDTAEKYRKGFESAGAVCIIQPEKQGDVRDPQASVAATVINHGVDRPDGSQIILTNIETVPGRTLVEHFGLVSGSTIRAKHVGRDIMAGLKNLVGGELKGYTQLLQESRSQATERMIRQAEQLGANAIVNVRYSTSSVAQGAAELYVYGTAVRVI